MHSFNKQITIEPGFTAEFFFNRIYTVDGMRYHISVKGKDRKFYFFTMEQRKNTWKIVRSEDLPPWIFTTEKDLAGTISWSLLEC